MRLHRLPSSRVPTPRGSFALVAATCATVVLAGLGGLRGGGTAAAEEPAAKLPWDGFGVGSSVHLRTTTTMSVAGVPPQTSESRQTLVKITDEAFTIKMETKVGEEWMATEMPWPRKATGVAPVAETPKPEELGDEDVTVDGKAYPCKKLRIVAQGTTVTSWVHAVEGALKVETKGAGFEASMAVTKLAMKTKVADKELEVRETVSVSKAAGNETKVTSWTSAAVPGGSARSETVTEMPGMKTTAVAEVIAFEVK